MQNWLKPDHFFLLRTKKDRNKSLVDLMITQTILLVNLPVIIIILLRQPYNIIIPVLDLGQFQLFLIPSPNHTLLSLKRATPCTIVNTIDLEADSRRAHLWLFSLSLEEHPHALFLFDQHVALRVLPVLDWDLFLALEEG